MKKIEDDWVSPREKAEEERDIYFGIINRFIGYFSRQSQKETRNQADIEYPFVAMDTRQMFDQIKFAFDYLTAAKKSGTFSFLDIGCGIGNAMLVAEQIGFDVYGFEKDEFPFRIACELMGANKVTQEDIRHYDKYEQFDLIYYFRPFSDGQLMREFEKMIEDRIKPGGILIANRKMSNVIDTDSRFVRLSPDMPIWRKEIRGKW